MNRDNLKTLSDEILASVSGQSPKCRTPRLLTAATELHREVHHRDRDHVYLLTLETRVYNGYGEIHVSFAHDDDGERAAAFMQQLEALGFRVEEIK